MTAEMIDGRAIARDLEDDVAREVKGLSADGTPSALAVVMVGETYSSSCCDRCRPGSTSPPSSAPSRCWRTSRRSIRRTPGLLALGTPRYVPSTAASALHVCDTWLLSKGHDLEDFYRRSSIAVVGRSSNVGKPAVSLAYARQAVVISVDEWASRLGRLAELTRQADVLVVAAGVPGLIGVDHVKEGAIVLDVGINPHQDPVSGQVHMVGDVDTAAAASRARAVTPVPGGIGPVTDVWLLRNTVSAARHVAAAPGDGC